MHTDVISFTAADIELFETACQIRRKVFVDEQKVSAEEEFDEFEENSRHYLVYSDGQPAGTARWRYTDNGIKLERFAMLKEYRNKKVGSIILKRILSDVEGLSDYIYLHAQVPAVNFYAREGFEKTGPMFSECDIDHYKMVLRD
ncbi:MAG: GNAT family N-acetyltransferase [Sphingobacteriales bacterium JAD_PAG50586_3]|nr:MAG: GNAT family N-acetyltransferase [Sphingobacteriales bacterium JAD_PAG50586_3]